MSMELHQWALNNKPIKIISLIREPIGRDVSDFFQLFEDYTGSLFKDSNYTTDELRRFFLNNIDPNKTLSWFDDNIKMHFGIDVYAEPFPEAGHLTLSRENTSLIVLRFDLDDSVKESIIRDFLDFPDFKIKRANLSSKKDYYQTYKDFQKNAKLPESYLNTMCNSKYFNHFFPEKEINDVRSKWSIKK